MRRLIVFRGHVFCPGHTCFARPDRGGTRVVSPVTASSADMPRPPQAAGKMRKCVDKTEKCTKNARRIDRKPAKNSENSENSENSGETSKKPPPAAPWEATFDAGGTSGCGHTCFARWDKGARYTVSGGTDEKLLVCALVTAVGYTCLFRSTR